MFQLDKGITMQYNLETECQHSSTKHKSKKLVYLLIFQEHMYLLMRCYLRIQRNLHQRVTSRHYRQNNYQTAPVKLPINNRANQLDYLQHHATSQFYTKRNYKFGHISQVRLLLITFLFKTSQVNNFNKLIIH